MNLLEMAKEKRCCWWLIGAFAAEIFPAILCRHSGQL